jgi:hypothetical protein
MYMKELTEREIAFSRGFNANQASVVVPAQPQQAVVSPCCPYRHFPPLFAPLVESRNR